MNIHIPPCSPPRSADHPRRPTRTIASFPPAGASARPCWRPTGQGSCRGAPSADLPALVFAQEYRTEFVTFGAGLVKPDSLQDGPCANDLPVVLGVNLAISEREGAD